VRLTWLVLKVPAPNMNPVLEGLVFLYTEGENQSDESYPILYFSTRKQANNLMVFPIASSKYGTYIKIKFLRGKSISVPLTCQNIEFRGRH